MPPQFLFWMIALVLLLASLMAFQLRRGRVVAWVLLAATVAFAATGCTFLPSEDTPGRFVFVYRWSGWVILLSAAAGLGCWIARQKALDSGRRRNSGWRKWLVATSAAGCVALAGHVVHAVPDVQADGWWAPLPATVLIAGSQWFPTEAIDGTASLRPNDHAAHLLARPLWSWQERWLAFNMRKEIGDEPTLRALAKCNTMVRAFPRSAFVDRLCDLSFRGLTSPDRAVRNAAAEYTREFLPNKTPYALEGVAYISAHAATLAPKLIPLIDDADERVTCAILETLSYCGGDAEPARARVLEIAYTGGGNWSRGYEATRVLKAIGYDPIGEAARVIAKVRSDDRPIRIDMLKKLAGMGYLDKGRIPIVNALKDRIRTGDDEESCLAAAAAANFWSDDDLYSVQSLIFDQLESQRIARAGFLDALPGYHPIDPFLSKVIACLDDRSPEVQAAAARLLSRRAENAAYDHKDLTSALPSLVRAAADSNTAVSDSAVDAIQVISRQFHTSP